SRWQSRGRCAWRTRRSSCWCNGFHDGGTGPPCRIPARVSSWLLWFSCVGGAFAGCCACGGFVRPAGRNAPGVIARGGDPGDSHVHAEEVRHGDRRTFRNIDGDDQKPLAVLPEHQVTLTLALGQSFCLITPQKEGHDYTAFERQQADPVDALKAHGPDVVGHRGVTAELGPLALVPPVSLANPVDAQAS